MLNTDRILVLAPHTDDGELGCGGSLAKYIALGKQVQYVAFSTCSKSLPAGLAPDTLEHECRRATGVLGVQDVTLLDYEVRSFPAYRQEILEELVRMNRQFAPQTVFFPARQDVHQDHQVIFAEALRAFRQCNLLGYELPWNNTRFQPTYFEKLDEQHLSGKEAALQEYASQSHRNYMKNGFVRSLAVVRGMQAGTQLAEAFELYRLTS